MEAEEVVAVVLVQQETLLFRHLVEQMEELVFFAQS
jgi:hypothetical protein